MDLDDHFCGDNSLTVAVSRNGEPAGSFDIPFTAGESLLPNDLRKD